MTLRKRNERSDKKHRIYPYLSKETFDRLNKIRLALNTQKAVSIHDIAEELLDVCTQSPEVITWLQNKYNVPMEHPMRLVRVNQMGKSVFMHLYEC